MADIVVNIKDGTQVVSKEGFGKVLILDTKKNSEYKEYDISTSLLELQKDFDTQTEVYKMVEVIAAQEPRPRKVATFGYDTSKSALEEGSPKDLTGALNELTNEHNNWYRLLCTDTSEEIKHKLGEWVEANAKMLYTIHNKLELTEDYSDMSRVFIAYKKDGKRVDAGAIGYALTRIPGSYTLKFKNFKNISPDILSSNELQSIRSKNMNAYIRKFDVQELGTSQLDEGKVMNGLFVDQVESRDWIRFRIENEIAKLLMSVEKVPYSELGIQMVVHAVEVALNDAFRNGIILGNRDNVPQFTVTNMNYDEIPLENRTKRKLTGIEFKYVEAGAIHEAWVNGTVVLSL